MDTRREFLKRALMATGAAGMTSAVPAAIKRALEINPAEGSTYLDAEHVVILMQENRAFDHVFGALRGVRGFNDPRAVKQPNGNLVWLQTDENGDTYAPFHFSIKETKITWMGDLPHQRSSQVDAFNEGRYDKWLKAKRSRNQEYADMPLTLGHYSRKDLPFSYAFADAFTVCDQHFCSAMTSTWPNRLYLWGGTVRGEKNMNSKAYIRNNIPWGEANWNTFPERLEENNISWKVYQNELSNRRNFTGEERSWLANFGCNPLEFLSQFNSRFSAGYVEALQRQLESLPREIQELETKINGMNTGDTVLQKLQKDIERKKEVLQSAQEQLQEWSRESFNQLSEYNKNLFRKAFTINDEDPDYLSLATLEYEDNGKKREIFIPKGDVLYQFRKDVGSGNLPAVSWIVPSQKLSGHPSAPWYGTWHTSEILDILTKNPRVWQKTIFILTYDENDGYYDHIPPFVAPDIRNPNKGKCSEGLETAAEYIKLESELEQGIDEKEARRGAIGLGYRVPMIVASPWSRGGRVCSQVLDATSVLQFLETFLSKKYNKDIRQEVITGWRRAVCGDLTSVFSRYDGEQVKNIPFINRAPFVEEIYDAQFTREPTSYKKLTTAEIAAINEDPLNAGGKSHQEPGVRIACPLPYQLYTEGILNESRNSLVVKMKAADEVFGNRTAGSPFNVYAPVKYSGDKGEEDETGRPWHFAVKRGDMISYEWPLEKFTGGIYHLDIYGPNGFFRTVTGDKTDPQVELVCDYQRMRLAKSALTGNIELFINNSDNKELVIQIEDNAYGDKTRVLKVAAGSEESVILNSKSVHGWYDFSVRIKGSKNYLRRYAGHVETGEESYSDPVMGKIKTTMNS